MHKRTKIFISALLTVFMFLLAGCRSMDSSGNGNNDGKDNGTDQKVIFAGEDEKEKEKEEEEKSHSELLYSIKDSAQNGKIINCEYEIKYGMFDIEQSWGKPDSEAYVEDAKGTYSDYKDRKVTFGWNKGLQIFEVRSFDDRLKEISYKELSDYFGKPDYNNDYNNEIITGYVVNDELKLLFVFDNNKDEKERKLDHYSVFYPSGTVNSMKADAGRQW